jgi:hypothetical protein
VVAVFPGDFRDDGDRVVMVSCARVYWGIGRFDRWGCAVDGLIEECGGIGGRFSGGIGVVWGFVR